MDTQSDLNMVPSRAKIRALAIGEMIFQGLCLTYGFYFYYGGFSEDFGKLLRTHWDEIPSFFPVDNSLPFGIGLPVVLIQTIGVSLLFKSTRKDKELEEARVLAQCWLNGQILYFFVYVLVCIYHEKYWVLVTFHVIRASLILTVRGYVQELWDEEARMLRNRRR